MDFPYRLVKQLYFFSTIAREKNVTRAAQKLGVSQPSLSEQLRYLEEHLGVVLFERLPRGMGLTTAALAILPEVEDFLARVDLLDKTLLGLSQNHQRVLPIGAIHDVMIHFIPKLLAQLRTSHPDILLTVEEITSSQIEPLVESKSILFSIGFTSWLENKNLQRMELWHEKPILIVSPTNPLSSKQSISWNDLQDENWVFIDRHVTHQYYDCISKMCLSHHITPRIKFTTNSVYAQIAYVACGQGIGIIPETFAKHLPDGVVPRRINSDGESWTVGLVWNPDVVSGARDEVLEVIKTMCKQPQAPAAAES